MRPADARLDELLGPGAAVFRASFDLLPDPVGVRFRWRLRDEFFGVNYRVVATVWDKDAQFSKPVARRKTTLD